MRVSERHAHSKYPFRAARSKFWLILRGAKFFLPKNFVSRHLKSKCASDKNLPKKSHFMLGFGNSLGYPLHIKCTITNSCLVFQCRLLSKAHSATFTNNRYANLPRIRHIFLNFLRYILTQYVGCVIIHIF